MYILTYVCHHFPKTIQIPTVSHMYNKFSQPNYSETLLLQSRLSSASSSPPSTSPIRESRYLPPHPVFPSPSPLANQGNHYSTLSKYTRLLLLTPPHLRPSSNTMYYTNIPLPTWSYGLPTGLFWRGYEVQRPGIYKGHEKEPVI